MQQWEYVFVTCEYANDDWQPRFVNGEELRDWQDGPPMYAFTNEMGAHGWELVSVAVPSNGQGIAVDIRLVFKRPKA